MSNSTRRFEFRDGKADKFWEITLSGSSHTVKYGRSGTDGRSTTKSFADSEKAENDHDKLIGQKLKKGYAEVSSGKASAKKKKASATKKTAQSSTASSRKKKATKTAARKTSKITKTGKKAPGVGATKKKGVKSKPAAKNRGKKLAVAGSNLIRISAELPMFDHKDKRTRKAEHLKLLDGFLEEHSLLEYTGNEFEDIPLSGGFLRCEVSKGKLQLITDYNSKSKLDSSQLKRLVDYTTGQWSDGVGEGCFDDFHTESGFSVEPPYKAKATQSKGVAVDTGNHKVKQTSLTKMWKTAMGKNLPKGKTKELVKLLSAIYRDKIREVQALLGSFDLNQVVKVKGKDGHLSDETPLTTAVRLASPKIVKVLLEAGADPMVPRDDGDFPIHCCCRADSMAMLLDAGVDPNLKSRKYDNARPLHRPEVLSDANSVRLLIKAGADPESQDHFKKTPLTFAAKSQAVDAAKALLAAGVHPSADALEEAAGALVNRFDPTEGKGYEQITKLLVNAGAEVTPDALCGATSFGTLTCLKLLLSTDPDVNAADFFGKTPLENALGSISVDRAKLLLKAGADVNSVPTALTDAIHYDNSQKVRLLIKHGMQPTPDDLELAGEHCPDVVKLLRSRLDD